MRNGKKGHIDTKDKIMRNGMLFLLVMLMLAGCNKKNEQPKPVETKVVTAAFWLTSGDGKTLLNREPDLKSSAVNNPNAVIEIDTTQVFQEMDGFGYTLTGERHFTEPDGFGRAAGLASGVVFERGDRGELSASEYRGVGSE